tara:strand:- start:324 stop:740 length:417 start_codon:yes stop_codon:yes gene_type:complete
MQHYEYESHISDFLFEEWKRFNDIKMREILKVEEYQEEPIKILENIKENTNVYSLANFTYFKQSQHTICTGFIISTIDGKICIPVIGMKHIRAKTQIKNSLINYLPRFKENNRKKAGLYLLNYTLLPIEIIQFIMKFY